MHDFFGDRMKMLEQVEAGRRLMPLLPICVRIDGKGFSKWTKDLQRPYDSLLSTVMIGVTKYLVEETNACIGYTESDEISLIIYSSNYDSQVYFDGKIQKLVSVIASLTTAKFNELIINYNNFYDVNVFPTTLATFDTRVWNVPTKEEAANVILWREQDATKNSISMAARHYYSHKELYNKNGSEMQEMLFQKGVNWNNYPNFFKRGTFVQRKKKLVQLTETELNKIPKKYRPTGPVERTIVEVLNMPPFGQVTNRVGVIFDREDPRECL